MLFMKKIVLGMLVTMGLFVFAGCSFNTSENYRQFLDIDFVLQLIHEAPTEEEINDLGLSLVNRGERINSERVAINNRRRQRAREERTQGTIRGNDGSVYRIDTVTTRNVPDSEIDLLPMVTFRNVLETDRIPRGARNDLEHIMFRFATTEGSDESHLYQISIHGLSYFHGVDFSQFTGETDADKIVDVLISTYGLDAEITGMGATPVISFFHEDVEFTMYGVARGRGAMSSMSVTVMQ